jgi:hypothetical protein
MGEIHRHVHFEVFKSSFKSRESLFAEAATFAETSVLSISLASLIRRIRAKALLRSGIGPMSGDELNKDLSENLRDRPRGRRTGSRGAETSCCGPPR